MDLNPNLQKNLYGFDNLFLDLKNLFDQNKLPNKILFSGQKGIGKCTLAYHLSNYILSINEIDPYNFEKKIINDANKSFKLVSNNSHPNFYLINLKDEKKSIGIEQVRKMINYTNMSSFNDGYKIILIDNVENLNLNSVNALLKIIEEPNNKVLFFLIHDIQKKIFDTFKSRCIEFKIFFSNQEKQKILENLLIYYDLKIDINQLEKIKSFYDSPGIILNLVKLINEAVIGVSNPNLIDVISNLMEFILRNKNNTNLNLLQNTIELFFFQELKKTNNKSKISLNYSKVLESLNSFRKYNIDMNNTFYEIKENIVHG